MMASRCPTSSLAVSGAARIASSSAALSAPSVPPLRTKASHLASTPARWSEPTTATTAPGPASAKLASSRMVCARMASLSSMQIFSNWSFGAGGGILACGWSVGSKSL